MLKNITWSVNIGKEMKKTTTTPTNLIVMTYIFLILEASTPTFHL
jgi:hypothetical protein